MSYPLAALLRIRLQREDQAIRKLAAARSAVRACQLELASAELALKDYQDWCAQESERLFESVTHDEVPLRRVVEVTEQIQWNHSQQANYALRVEEAQKQLAEAEGHLLECEFEQQKASKEVWKLTTHREAWLKEQQAIEAAEEEKVLEEVATIGYTYNKLNL